MVQIHDAVRWEWRQEWRLEHKDRGEKQGGSELIDLWSLSLCDELVHSSSTFSNWAGLIGEASVRATAEGMKRAVARGRRGASHGGGVGRIPLGDLSVPPRRCSVTAPVGYLFQLEEDPQLGPPSSGCSRLVKEWWHAQRAAWVGPRGVAQDLFEAASKKEAQAAYDRHAGTYRLGWGGQLGNASLGSAKIGPYMA